MNAIAITPDRKLIHLEDLMVTGTAPDHGGVASVAELLEISRDAAFVVAVQMGLVVGEDPEAIRLELQGVLPLLMERLQRAGLMRSYAVPAQS
ncbi:MAG TPA: hypothetical protein VN436_09575 [Holophaga sp.]|nr:hypothetical protein [Holophaga sp.]